MRINANIRPDGVWGYRSEKSKKKLLREIACKRILSAGAKDCPLTDTKLGLFGKTSGVVWGGFMTQSSSLNSSVFMVRW